MGVYGGVDLCSVVWNFQLIRDIFLFEIFLFFPSFSSTR